MELLCDYRNISRPIFEKHNGRAVNIAARIEPLAYPSGVCVTEQVYDQVKGIVSYSIKSIVKKRENILNFKILLILLTLMLIFGIYFGIKNFRKIEIRKAEKMETKWVDSIAVLPFVNLAQDKENDLFTDGITEETINSLSRIKGLKVCARTSAFFFKGKKHDIRTIGKKLGVNLILEGSARKAENQYKSVF